MDVRNVGALSAFWTRHPDAARPLQRWLLIVRNAQWRNPMDCRQTFPAADRVRLEDGQTVTVFNIKGNSYRLVAAILYPAGLVVVRAVMTHPEYDQNAWKETL